MNSAFTPRFGWNVGIWKCYPPRFFPIFFCMSGAPLPDDNPEFSAAPAEEAAVGYSPHPLIVRLVEWRRAKGWTQEETATHFGIPLNTLRGYECGNRNPGGSNTEKILNVIGLPKRKPH